ncbi:3-hydroxyacyl-CoA dehydrogenase [Azohydromonas australica]|uniref:3-hydroxyacyl-CoA dehydrogenase n=1 Tax=Azohydromonas australica TaxID=364039 RepID=UPI000403F2E3|nr:3-hydroxyacyl-CoA dehydrogenase [Azohydromonas australica]
MDERSSLPLPLTKAVVVIGAGTMGCGIAEVAAVAGHRVYLRDNNPAALEKGLALVQRSLDKRVQRGRLDAAVRDAVFERIVPAAADTALHGVGLVIEVIVEDLEAKVAVLSRIEAQLEPEAIIATNTSSLSVTALAGRLARPERVVGMHFFNPATVLPLVEVIAGHSTAPEVTRCITDTARAWGKVPVACSSTPGFIVNRVARPFYGEALRVLQEQGASPVSLDAVLRESGGFKMGPCELMDLIGHDVNFAVTRSVYQGFFDDPRYKPSLVQKALVDAGWLGRKSGRGFFDYREGAAPPVPEEAGDQGVGPAQVRVEGHLGPAAALEDMLRSQEAIEVQHTAGAGLLRVDGLALALSDGRTATERSAVAGEPVVLFDLALDWSQCTRVALAAPLQASAEHLAKAIGLFTLLGKKVTVLADVPGLAVMRTVAMLVNEAADAVYQGVASAEDVDAAMKMGVNYPIGPMAWGRRIGLLHVLTVMQHLARAYGDGRYRPSIWLQRTVHASATVEGISHD